MRRCLRVRIRQTMLRVAELDLVTGIMINRPHGAHGH